MPESNTPRYHAEPGAAAPAFAQVRDLVMALRAEGDTDQAFDLLLSALAAVLRKSRELELLLAKVRRAGRSSERMNPEQLALLFRSCSSSWAARRRRPIRKPKPSTMPSWTPS